MSWSGKIKTINMADSSSNRSAQLLQFTAQLYTIFVMMLLCSALESLDIDKNTECHENGKPPADVVFMMCTSDSVADTDVRYMKTFQEEMFKGTNRYSNIDKGFRYTAVSFGDTHQSNLTYDQEYNLTSFSDSLKEFRKSGGDSCDLLHTLSDWNPTIRKNSRENVPLILIVTYHKPLKHYNWIVEKVLNELHDTYKVIIPIGITRAIKKKNIFELATNKKENEGYFLFNSYQELSEKWKLPLTILCSQTTSSECPTLQPFPNSDVFYTSTKPNGKAIFVCHDGYALVAKPGIRVTAVCSEHGKWIGIIPFPRCKGTCPIPSAPSNGRVSYERTLIGKKAQYHCNQGFTARGNVQARCLLNRTWSSPPPECQEFKCPPPPDIKDGQVDYRDTKIGTTAVYRCNSGFAINKGGNPVITCLSSLQWNIQLPQCVYICPSLSDPENGKVIQPYRFVGETAVFQCNHGYTTSENTEAVCLESREWSKTNITCSEKEWKSTWIIKEKSTSNSHNSYSKSSSGSFGKPSGKFLLAGKKIQVEPTAASDLSIVEPTSVIFGLIVCCVIGVAIYKITVCSKKNPTIQSVESKSAQQPKEGETSNALTLNVDQSEEVKSEPPPQQNPS